jgi:two-component system, NtrC family, nitrogen regulation response regulator NtrX
VNVLIVDDEVNICITLKKILEDDGFRVEYTHSGHDALQRLETFSPDAVLLDVKMEGMDGIDALERMLAVDPALKVVMISGHSGISDAVKAIKIGAFDFLEKPLSLPRVRLAVNKAVEYGRIAQENQRLRARWQESGHMIGDSRVMQELREMIAKVGASNAKVLIRGESGAGKELIAMGLHAASKRADKPFVKFNSAAIPNELVESELFGFEKGAFTGAVKSKRGKLEEADGGSLFLDEIGDMSLSAQAKILRVIQEGEFERVGGNTTKKIDARIIAATHKPLEHLVETGEFRQDLYYRLNVVPIISPPLREHPEDIPTLVAHFSDIFTRECNIPPRMFPADTLRELQSWKFPGNVRELRNLVERIYILIEHPVVTPADLLTFRPDQPTGSGNECDHFFAETAPFNEKRNEFETRYLTTQLALFNQSVTQTARALGVHQSNLSRKLKELGIQIDKTNE